MKYRKGHHYHERTEERTRRHEGQQSTGVEIRSMKVEKMGPEDRIEKTGGDNRVQEKKLEA